MRGRLISYIFVTVTDDSWQLEPMPLTDVVDSGSSTLTEPNVSDAIVIPTYTLPKNPTTLLTDITNVSEHQSTTTLTPTATANQPP